MRFFVGLRLLQGHDLRFRQHHAFLGDLRFERLEPFPHRLQIMPKPDAADARGRDRQGLFAQFIRHAQLAPGGLVNGHLHNGLFHLR